jgi:hypothetical protein
MKVSGQLHVSGRFTSGERALGTYLMRKWVGSRIGVDVVARKKNRDRAGNRTAAIHLAV